MGIITSVCKKGDKDIQIEKLQNKLMRQKNRTSKALEEISYQKLNIHNHVLQAAQYEEDIEIFLIKAAQYEEDIKQYRIKAIRLIKYESTIKYSDALASHILSTELNCRWMNDDYEKEYLISVFDYITVAIADQSFNLQPPDEPEQKALESEKMINQPYHKFDQVEMMYSDDELL
jgi:hypothetical protein